MANIHGRGGGGWRDSAQRDETQARGGVGESPKMTSLYTPLMEECSNLKLS